MRLLRSLKKLFKAGLLVLAFLTFLYIVRYDHGIIIVPSQEIFISKNLDSFKVPLFPTTSTNNNDESILVYNPPKDLRVNLTPEPKSSLRNLQNSTDLETKETKTDALSITSTDTNSSLNISKHDIINRFWTVVKNRKEYKIDSNISIPSQNIFSREQLSTLNLWQLNYSTSFFEDDRFLAQLVFQSDFATSFANTIKPKLILAHSGFHAWWRSDWNSALIKGKYILSKEECPSFPGSKRGYGGCIFTEDKSLVNKADVILMQGSYQLKGNLKSQNVLKFSYILESPYHSSGTFFGNNNMLATYWSGSHLPTPYFIWVYFNPNVIAKPQGRDYSKGKSKPGAMFVSNCSPRNNRMGYIEELQKYIQVDVYGSCGTMSCSRNSAACPDLLKKDYYFYFAFENSNCRDYITEKVSYNAFPNNVVPIVMGAHPEDYRAKAPIHSYIHIEDFKSPQALASHLNFLISNPSEYNRYFEWKGTGTFVSGEFFCRLCALSHYADIVPPPKIFTKPFEWEPDSQVTSRNISSRMCLNYDTWYWETKPERKRNIRFFK